MHVKEEVVKLLFEDVSVGISQYVCWKVLEIKLDRIGLEYATLATVLIEQADYVVQILRIFDRNTDHLFVQYLGVLDC